MNPLNDFKCFKCLACYFFQKGLCLCVRTKDGPRATRDCRTCRCQIVNLILYQKIRTQKMFYHIRNTGLCNCKLLCKLRNDGKQCQKKTKNGKVTFTVHKSCEPYYLQCKQMQELEKNFKELCLLYKETGTITIPSNCTPFLGTARRNFPEVKKFEKECYTRRGEMASQVKNAINWKKPSKRKLSDENLAMSAKVKTSMQERLETSPNCPSFSIHTSETSEENCNVSNIHAHFPVITCEYAPRFGLKSNRISMDYPPPPRPRG